MTRKNKSNKKMKSLINKVERLKVKENKKKIDPYKGVLGKSGDILGTQIGGLFGMGKLGGNIGKFLGNGIASIIGQGDYTMSGPANDYNVFTNSSQIPKFSTTERTNVICHREYLGDIVGTATFTNLPYAINPGMASTFPWLSNIASGFQEYAFHGLIFEFRPLTTDYANSGVPGVVVMATDYNADAPLFTTKQEMENSEYAVSVKPTLPLIHGIECKPGLNQMGHRYVRTGAVPTGQDLRLYDYGNFQFATQNNSSSVTLGELWVSYCVEFFKPILPANDVGYSVQSYHYYSTGATSGSPLGTLTGYGVGNLPGFSNTTSAASWEAQNQEQFLVTISWNGSSVSGTVVPGISALSGTLLARWENQTATVAVAPGNGAVSTAMSNTFVLQASSGGTVGFAVGTSGSIPSGSVDVIISTLSPSVTQ